MFTAKIISNVQNKSGDLDVTVEYSNGVISISEVYPTEANSETLRTTISNRINQLQKASDFVTSNPPGTEISATPSVTPITVNDTPAAVV